VADFAREADAKEKPPTVKLDPELTPGEPHVFTLPDGRQYGVYVPKDLHYPAGVLVAADGLVGKGKNPETQMGKVNGIYAEADKDKDFIVITPHPVKEWTPPFHIMGTLEAFNIPGVASGYDADGPNDTALFNNMLDDVPKRVPGANLNDVACIGFSTGGQYLHSMNEQRDGVPRDPPCKTIAMVSSGATPEEAPTKPGIKEIYIFNEDSGIKPNGGLDSSKAGWMAWGLDLLKGNNDAGRAIPNLLPERQITVNHMDRTQMRTSQHGPFVKSVLSASNGAQLWQYNVSKPYGGHNFAGSTGHPADGSLPIPAKLLSPPHLTACAQGWEKNCQSEGLE
jgi:hypothetical protein